METRQMTPFSHLLFLFYYFKISPPFSAVLFSEKYLNPQARINKMVNKYTVDYHPCLSQSISTIHTLIFLWTPKGFISPESFLNFFAKSVYSTKVVETFQSYNVKITANTFVSQKN